MEAVLICVPMFYFIYSIISQLIRNSYSKSIVRIYAEKGVLNPSSEIKFNFNENADKKTTLLPIALGIMGISLGMFFAFILSISISEEIGHYQRGWIELSLPLFFGSLGLLVAYFLEKKK